jgi:hypothetical protein
MLANYKIVAPYLYEPLYKRHPVIAGFRSVRGALRQQITGGAVYPIGNCRYFKVRDNGMHNSR